MGYLGFTYLYKENVPSVFLVTVEPRAHHHEHSSRNSLYTSMGGGHMAKVLYEWNLPTVLRMNGKGLKQRVLLPTASIRWVANNP